MSLTKFESNDSEAKALGSTIATPEEFVNKCGGKRVINKILIANNGIAGIWKKYCYFFQSKCKKK